MNKGIKKLVKILEHPRHKQIRGDLIKFTVPKYEANSKSKIVGKCALGEIGCQIGYTPMDLVALDLDTKWYSKIMETVKVPKFLVTGENLPEINSRFLNNMLKGVKKYKKENTNVSFDLSDFVDYDKSEIRLNGGNNIDTYIYSLNDAGFTYKQIAEFLTVTFGSLK